MQKDGIFEYNETRGKFYINDGSSWSDIFGWETLCKSISYRQCVEFVKLMEGKYPCLKYTSNALKFPDFGTIKNEFVEFLLT